MVGPSAAPELVFQAVVFFGKAGSGVFQYWQWGFLADTDTDTDTLIL